MSNVRQRKRCEKCGDYFSLRGGNFQRHHKVCCGDNQKNSCRYCNISLSDLPKNKRACHVKWCDKNPNKNKYLNQLKENRSLIGEKERKIAGQKIKQLHKDGHYNGCPEKSIKTKISNGNCYHSDETKKLISEKALASKHRRLKRKVIEYNGIFLDSSWELILAIRLDDLGLNWIRPNPIPWIDDNEKVHNYFPDFYQ